MGPSHTRRLDTPILNLSASSGLGRSEMLARRIGRAEPIEAPNGGLWSRKARLKNFGLQGASATGEDLEEEGIQVSNPLTAREMHS